MTSFYWQSCRQHWTNGDCVSHGCGLVMNADKTKVMVGKEVNVT